MLKVGLTGGIGAGKTTVSDRFRELGVPVIDTDLISRELVSPGSASLNEIVREFGDDVLAGNGELDRKTLGRIVFSDRGKRELLEAILHPRIRKAVLERTEKLRTPYCIIVVPLLIETDFLSLVDKVLVVDAPDNKRIDWIQARNGLSEIEVRNILDAQTTRETRLAAADYTINNDGSVEELQAKVGEIHSRIMRECRSS